MFDRRRCGNAESLKDRTNTVRVSVEQVALMFGHHEELVGMAILLLMAGHETTANLLGNGLVSLLAQPEQWSRYKTDEAIDRTTIEELMRYDGPIQMTERITLEDIQLGVARIPKGSMVILCVAAANRDPQTFDDADALDLARDPNPHLGFGGGAHFCLGAPLARLEARIALRSLAERIPNLTVDTDRLKWRPSFTIRGLRELPLTWSTKAMRKLAWQ